MSKNRYDVEQLFGNPETLLGFMRRTRKPVFHNSNVFFRDIQFAIRDYYDTVEAKPISLTRAEQLAREVIRLYTDVGLLRAVGNGAYLLNAPEFSTPKGGTYSMLTVHGAPLPEVAETWLEIATVGSPIDPSLRDEVREYKGGEVSPDGATIAALTLPIAPPENAEPGHIGLEHQYEEIGTATGPASETLPEAERKVDKFKAAQHEAAEPEKREDLEAGSNGAAPEGGAPKETPKDEAAAKPLPPWMRKK